MTEQPVETEQQFLGNVSNADCANCSGQIRRTVNLACPSCGRDFSNDPEQAVVGETEEGTVEFVFLREIPIQHYAPGAHRLPPAWTSGDDVEVSALIRKCTNAAKILAIAKSKSLEAEAALQTALDVEAEAADKLNDAEKALLVYTRKDAGL
jgi:hypothetical protein